MRFQALMPDVSLPSEKAIFVKVNTINPTSTQILHWLGIQKIDRMLSMSK